MPKLEVVLYHTRVELWLNLHGHHLLRCVYLPNRGLAVALARRYAKEEGSQVKILA